MGSINLYRPEWVLSEAAPAPIRHSCATLMLEGGADVRHVQALLGHSKLETTQLYTHVSIRKLKEIHSACHPARLRQSLSGKEPGEDSAAKVGKSGKGKSE